MNKKRATKEFKRISEGVKFFESYPRRWNKKQALKFSTRWLEACRNFVSAIHGEKSLADHAEEIFSEKD